MTTETKTLWKIDPTHSEVQFKVKHLVISTVTGSFGSLTDKLKPMAMNLKMRKQHLPLISTVFQPTMKIAIST
jgi:polyisoprenoid-binding protein YceI